jgi:hypothetical protein
MCQYGLERSREVVSVDDNWALAQRLSGILAADARSATAFDLFAGLPDETEHAVGDH